MYFAFVTHVDVLLTISW